MKSAPSLVRYASAAVLGAFAIAAAVVTTVVAFDQISARQQGSRVAIGAAIAERSALVALTDQDTAVRIYVSSGDASFLEPYAPGRDAYATYRAALPRLNDPDANAALDEFVRTGDALETRFNDELRTMQRGDRRQALAALRAQRTAFDQVRRADLIAIAALKASLDQDNAAIASAILLARTVIITTALLLGLAGALTALLGSQASAAAALARRDELTRLPNRRAFDERLTEVLGGRGPDERIGVLWIDLDRFKPINDRLGHAAGDIVLGLCGERMRRAVRPNDFVARIGGDEFAVILEKISSRADARAIAERIIREIEAPFSIAGTSVTISASVGDAVVPDDADDAKEIVRIADVAMYRVKQTRGSSPP